MTRHSLAFSIVIALCSAAAFPQVPIGTSENLNANLNDSLNQRLQKSAEGARWLWGTLRVEPAFGLRNVRLVDDVEIDSDAALAGAETSSDVTIGTFAGLHLYQLFGESSSAAFFVRPQYDHWVDLEERSRLNMNFGAALAVETNRFFLDLEGVRSEGQGIVTNEAEQIINNRRDRLGIRLGVPIYRSIALVGTYSHTESENLLDESPSETVPNFGRLDETIGSGAVGFQVEPGRVTRLFLGYRKLEADAARTLRNYEAEGPTALIQIDAGVLSLRALVDQLEYVPDGTTSSFEATDITSGRLDLILDGAGPHFLRLTSQRSLTPSVRSSFTDFETDSSELRWQFRATDRVQPFVGFQLIERDYRSAERRRDEQETLLAGASYTVGKLRLSVQYQRSEIDSTVDLFDRDTQRLGLSFAFALPGLSWP